MSEPRKGREGGRWINEKPTPEEFGDWFKTNMRLDSALGEDAHEKYVGGVVLIPAVDGHAKVVTGYEPNGAPVIEEMSELSYIPYAKVDTRINYFWDLLDAREEWTGVVTPERLDRMPIEAAATVTTITEDGRTRTVAQPGRPGQLSALVYQLPEGFSLMSVPLSEGMANFLLSTVRVSIYLTEDIKAALEKGKTAAEALKLCVPRRTGRGTKQIPLLGRYGADANSIMKAETGALGRALGFAGIFVIPGSGVATAEDMQEFSSEGVERAAPPQPPSDAPARTPAEATADEAKQLHDRALELYNTLKQRGADDPQFKEFQSWAQKRNLRSVAETKGAALRGLVKKLENLTDEGRDDVPAETAEEPVSAGAEAGAAEPGPGDGDAVRGDSQPPEVE